MTTERFRRVAARSDVKISSEDPSWSWVGPELELGGSELELELELGRRAGVKFNCLQCRKDSTVMLKSARETRAGAGEVNKLGSVTYAHSYCHE